ncbi:MAG: ASCH domain-containing protein [Burkholderiales bacterium]
MTLPSVAEVLADLAARGVILPEGPVNVGSYGDSETLSAELIALIVSGAKRAGTSLLRSHEFDDEPLPRPGNLEVVVDYRGEPVLVTRILTVEVVAFDAVTPEYARIEGEGDGSLEFWREGHWAFFSRECARIGCTPCSDMRVVCATFDVPLIVPARARA